MTISNSTTKKIYNGTGGVVTFAYDFYISDAAELKVYLEIAGVLELQELNTDYTITGVGESLGGSITFGTAPAAGTANVLLIRQTPHTQETDYIEGDDFPAESHEEALDKLTRICQEQQEAIDRSVKVDANDSTTPDELLTSISAAVAAAEDAADAAEDSETAAATSATNASNSASAAATSATNAATSATNAAASETAAATSETNAAASETAAATSATNAATSEANAAASETAAATSETNAATSEANTAASEANVETLFDQFDDRFLGSKAADPTLDNDGNALIEGAVYWNTISKIFKVYNGTAWVGAALGVPADNSITRAMLSTGETFGLLLNIQIFTASGNYTPTAGTRRVIITALGGGGGGGHSSTSNDTVGGGGAAGGYIKALLNLDAVVSSTITVGSAGAAGTAGASGGSGGNTSWSDGTNTLAANGGSGGNAGGGVTPASGGSTSASGGFMTIVAISGANGGRGGGGSVSINNGLGGNCPLGFTGTPDSNNTSLPSVGYGAGGAGGYRASSSAAGAAGRAGILIIEEYA
ncbi:MAG TPA: hypothetical protein VD999_07880 [Vitreimonas sp.]|nr:hypothetical protein [Vitreimonas sp.]